MTLRERFELWLKSRGITPQYTCDNEYSDHDVRIMWEAWEGGIKDFLQGWEKSRGTE